MHFQKGRHHLSLFWPIKAVRLPGYGQYNKKGSFIDRLVSVWLIKTDKLHSYPKLTEKGPLCFPVWLIEIAVWLVMYNRQKKSSCIALIV
jgi:hypothetical protein